MTATNAQVGIIMRERQKGRTQEQAAARANLKSRKTVAKYEQFGQLPGELKRTRTYRTWPDSFVEDWELVAGMLQDAPELAAVRHCDRQLPAWKLSSKHAISCLQLRL